MKSNKVILLFPLILIVIMVVNIGVHGEELFNELLKNTYSVDDYFSGQVFRDVETLFTDHFLFRKELEASSKVIESLNGYKEEMEIIDTNAINVANKADDTLLDNTSMGSLLLIDNKAMELNFKNDYAMTTYATCLNEIAKTLGDDVQVYSMLVPTQIEFARENDYQGYSYSQRDALDFTYNQYENIQVIDVYDALKGHSEEYIYFRTDHHWTQLGAKYAYDRFCEILGFDYVSEDEFDTFKVDGFLGSLYNITHHPKLEEAPDTIFVLEPKVSNTYVADGVEIGHAIDIGYVQENNKYAVFLDGDHTTARIKTDLNNGRKIIVVKDSYANAFVPFLVYNYEEIITIDPRLWNGNLYDLVKNEGIEEVLFLNYSLINRYEVYGEEILPSILSKENE